MALLAASRKNLRRAARGARYAGLEGRETRCLFASRLWKIAEGTEQTGQAMRLFVGSEDRSTKNQRAQTPQNAHSSRCIECVLPPATCRVPSSNVRTAMALY